MGTTMVGGKFWKGQTTGVVERGATAVAVAELKKLRDEEDEVKI